VHHKIKEILGYNARDSAAKILADWKRRTRQACKPCWELKYCPFGPLVEQFPLPPVSKAEAIDHQEYLEACLRENKLADGRALDKKRRRWFEGEIADFSEDDHPEEIPSIIDDASCRVFGHLCPVFFVAEPLTETKERRKHSRSIPRDVMLKVVRRDGQICQECYEPVPDDQVEFDHIIPFSKGGTSTADNLRLLCRTCNRDKRDSLDVILAPNPLTHLVELQEKLAKKTKTKPSALR
jgi:5-methylcytosine-specific restriction endonuclease McrA